MAQLPAHRARPVRALAAGFVAVAALSGSATADESPLAPLVGTWHVLVHYTDDNSPHPDVMRWDDRIWIFEESASRVRWKEYPIAVFQDDSERFERRSTGQYARVTHAWEPSAAQLENIRDGLEVNDRGMKSKTLRDVNDEGWTSETRASPASSSIITYHETWRVMGMPDAPIFVREDFLGSGQSENMEGRTEYRTTEVRDAGDLYVGTFERDGTRHGTFRMLRSGSVSKLTSNRTQAERRGADAYSQAILAPGGAPEEPPTEGELGDE